MTDVKHTFWEEFQSIISHLNIKAFQHILHLNKQYNTLRRIIVSTSLLIFSYPVTFICTQCNSYLRLLEVIPELIITSPTHV